MFSLNDNTALITGGCGFLGVKHAEAILEFGGEVILADIITKDDRFDIVKKLRDKYPNAVIIGMIKEIGNKMVFMKNLKKLRFFIIE